MKTLLVLLATVAQSSAVTPAAGQAPPAGIAGVVVRAGTGEPIAGARVFASFNDQADDFLLEFDADSDDLSFLAQATTDARGRFLFTDLAPGTYTVTAHRRGFAPQQFGARAPRRPGTRLTIAAGARAQNIVIPLVPTGAISGRVTDQAGEPIARMAVLIQRLEYGADGRRTPRIAATSHTNDRGEYRAYWLTPGRYYVLVSPQRAGSQEIAAAGYVATYYPGVADRDSASVIDVAPGSEVGAIDFGLTRQPVFHVRGHLPVTGGLRPDLVWLSSNDLAADDAHYEGAVWGSAFEIRNVVAGSYSIHAHAGEVPLLKGLVHVSDADVEHVDLISDRGSSIEGRLTWEGAGPLSEADRERLWLTLDQVGPTFQDDQRSSTVRPDGSLRFGSVVPGDYRLRAAVLPQGTYVKSARLAGIDALTGFSISGPETATLDIVLSGTTARIEGTVVDKKGRPVPGVEAVLLPIRETDRTTGRVRTVVTDQNGRFDLQSIAPGDYKLLAWEDLEPYGYYDADFVRPYMAAATAIRVSEHSRHSIRIESIPPR